MNIKAGLLTSPRLYRAALVYRLSPLLATGATVAFFWIVILCTLASSPSPHGGSAASVGGLITLILLGVGTLLCPMTLGTCILVAPEGLLYRSMGTCVYTPWNNIEGVEKKTMGAFPVENVRLHREAIAGLSLEEGIQKQRAIITKVWAVHATEQALPTLRALAPVLSLLSLVASGRAVHISRAPNPSLQKYIPVGLFGSAWTQGALWSDIARYRRTAEQQHEQKQD